jgi:hypothetical protein
VTAAVQERIQAGAVPELTVDVRGAMRMLHLGRSTVLALADADLLPRLRVGRAVRFAVCDVEHLVDRMRNGEQLLAGTKTTSARGLPAPARGNS